MSNRTVVEPPPSKSDPTRSTDMTITGTLDPEEDTIFIKAQISDKNGMSKLAFLLYMQRGFLMRIGIGYNCLFKL